MRVLVTGASGMLGKAVVPALEDAGHDVLPLGRRDGDVTRYDSLRHPVRTFEPEWVFHLAGHTRVDDCEAEAEHAYLVNTIGARNAALAAASAGAAVLLVSTDYVFDGESRVPYREYDEARPTSVYGASKVAGERAVRDVNARHLIVRTAWLFGRGGANFVDTIVKRAGAGEPLTVVDDQRGAPTWTRDLAGALLKLTTGGQLGTIHITSAGEASWYEVAEYVLSRAGLPASISRTDSATLGRPARRPAYSVLNNLAYRQATGDRLAHWQDAIDRYLASRTSGGDS